jgi:hypothetical protein
MAGPFFTVFNPNGEAPARKKYGSHGSAMRDACRLAKDHPEETFFVMRTASRPITADVVRAGEKAKAEALAEGEDE